MQENTTAALELGMQELDVQELEALDAPFGWSDALSFVSGLSAGGGASYVASVLILT